VIQTEWNAMALHEYNNNVPLKAGVYKFLEFLKVSGIKIGLATSNSQQLLELSLRKNGIYQYFDSITTTNEVSKGKDSPDIYLLAAKKLGTKPENCIVFEDILPAVLSAKTAGMKVIGVYDAAAKHQKEEILAKADRFIVGYDELMTG
jgi:HAD superfamily hydrolase (TIGR01509 family)